MHLGRLEASGTPPLGPHPVATAKSATRHRRMPPGGKTAPVRSPLVRVTQLSQPPLSPPQGLGILAGNIRHRPQEAICWFRL